MQEKQKLPEQPSHSGGNTKFWQNEMVQKYDYQQSLVSEKKEEVLANILRILTYFCKVNTIIAPKIIDIGCGPGTPVTLSSYILRDLPSSNVVGIDSSKQMVDAAKQNLQPIYGERFAAYVGDFNSNEFWTRQIDKTYDFAVSSGSLHYLSDNRRVAFLREVYGHLESCGILIASIANCSGISEIAEMAHIFRMEYTYSKLVEGKKPKTFKDFRKFYEEVDKKANINWKSQTIWLDSMRSAGFKAVDIVWHLWVRSIFVAIK